MNRQTFQAKPGNFQQDWYVVDASEKVLGRLATEIATILMGKNKPTYTPHQDTGDFVVVLNADKIQLTGQKLDQKFRETYSGHPGGRKLVSYRNVLETHPERLIEDAVRRMLPKNRLGRQMYGKLKVYAGSEHPHQAQQPKTLELATA